MESGPFWKSKFAIWSAPSTGCTVAHIIGNDEDPFWTENPEQRDRGADVAVGAVDSFEKQALDRTERLTIDFDECLAVVRTDRVVEHL